MRRRQGDFIRAWHPHAASASACRKLDGASRPTERMPRACHPARKCCAGFTLLEVVLAVTLALALMAAMLTFYKQAAEVRAAVLDDIRVVGAERAIMARMTWELRSSFVYQFLGLGLEGGTSEVRLMTVTFPSGAMWFEQKVTDTDQAPRESDMMIVDYRLRYSEDQEGRPQVDGLERTCQRTPTARISEEGKEIEVSLVSPDIKFLRLRYWDGTAWIESWGGGGLPQAVEIVLGREPLPERVEPARYPYPTFRRVVAVPASPKTAPAAASRGGEESGT